MTGKGEGMRPLSFFLNVFQQFCSVAVHVAKGTDIVPIHPSEGGAAIGKTSHQDFKLFCNLVIDVDGGAYLNIGSAVLLPEVFLDATVNVVDRPTMVGGRGFHITGHHDMIVPLLAALRINISLSFLVENSLKSVLSLLKRYTFIPSRGERSVRPKNRGW